MALGTITKVTPNADFTSGNKRVRVRDIQLTSGANYTTTGAAITAPQVGLRSRIEQVAVLGPAVNAAGTASVSVAWNYTSGKLQCYFSVSTLADAEVAANADLSTYSVRIAFTGV